MSNSILGITEKNCCGCGACYQSCPKKAITMNENDRGFLVPTVDENECVNCGKCVAVCPEKDTPDFYSVKNAYVAVAKDMPMIKVSTSGGIFGVLAEKVLSNSGIVYGCGWGDNLQAKHMRIEKESDLHLIQQSKYVQSNTEKTFVSVKKDLIADKTVLYSGTACQIGGLRKYLGKEYDKLITLEVACHGAPSPGLFRKYIEFIESNNRKKVTNFRFRNKEKHSKGEHYKFCVTFEDGSQMYKLSNEDPYYGSFLGGKTLRETCYNCKYKEKNRVADFMLSDYWGVEKEHKGFPSENGASAIFVCSGKAEKLLNSVKDKLTIDNSTVEKVIAHNHSLVSSAKIEEESKLKTINVDNNKLFQSLKPPFNIKKRIKNMVPEKLKYFLKKI